MIICCIVELYCSELGHVYILINYNIFSCIIFCKLFNISVAYAKES